MPCRCVFCGTRCDRFEPHLCAGCFADLPWNREAVQADMPQFVTAVAPLRYVFPVDAALKALKFKRRLDYVPALAELLWCMFDQLPDDIDALLPVPLHWRRHLMRGFNQATELCALLRSRSNLPVLQNLRRVRATPFQSGLDAVARRRNLQGAFVALGPVAAEHVLIVDDIITTGETCGQLAEVVMAAGAKKVSVLAVARA